MLLVFLGVITVIRAVRIIVSVTQGDENKQGRQALPRTRQDFGERPAEFKIMYY